MLGVMKQINEKILFPYRRSYLSNELSNVICKANIVKSPKDSISDAVVKVLDIGCSCGRLAKEINKLSPEIEFEGVDTYIQPETHIKVTQYDGSNIPHEDLSYNLVTIIDVLHHAEDLEQVIKEASRVSNKYILIKDHFYENELEFQLLKYADYFGNKPYNIDLQYKYLKLSEWEETFEKNNLKIVFSKKFKYNFFDPCNHVTFLLEKK